MADETPKPPSPSPPVRVKATEPPAKTPQKVVTAAEPLTLETPVGVSTSVFYSASIKRATPKISKL